MFCRTNVEKAIVSCIFKFRHFHILSIFFIRIAFFFCQLSNFVTRLDREKNDTCPRSVVWDSADDGTTRPSPRGSSCRGISASRVVAGRETPRVRSHLCDNCRRTGDVDSEIGETRRRGSRGSATPRTRSTRSRRIARWGRSGRCGYTRRRSTARCRQSVLSCICRALGQLGRPTPKAAISNWPSFLVVAGPVGYLEEGMPLMRYRRYFQNYNHSLIKDLLLKILPKYNKLY